MSFPLRPVLFSFFLVLSPLAAETVTAPRVSFDIYVDSGKNYAENGWIGSGNGDVVSASNNRWLTTWPDGPAYSGKDSLLFEWDHRNNGWTAGSVARDWWIPIDISDFIANDGRVEFMAKSDKGGENITVNLSAGENINSPSLRVSTYLDGSPLTKEWRKVSIPLKDFSADFLAKCENKLQTVGFGIDYGLPGKHRVYIDDIRLVHYYGNPEPGKGIQLGNLQLSARPVAEFKGGPLVGVVADKWKVAESIDLSVARIKSLGYKALRLDFPWVSIEPARGEFQFLDYGNILAECEKNGITVIACVKGTPFWARKTVNPAGVEPADAFTLRPAAEMLDWAAFMLHLATRYKGKIKYWEIWENEDATMSEKDYAGLLDYASRAVKTVDTNAVVISGCVKNPEFLASLNSSTACDLVGYRMDASATDPATILSKIPEMNKPVWLTSAGAAAGPGADCRERKLWMDKLLAAVRQTGKARAVFWYELFDDNKDPVFPASGLLDAGYQLKCK